MANLVAGVRWVEVLLHVFVLIVDDRAADVLVMPELSNLVSHPLVTSFLICFEVAPLLVQRGLRVHGRPVNEDAP